MKFPESGAANPVRIAPAAWVGQALSRLDSRLSDLTWQRLGGGRINEVWLSPAGVLKIYCPDGGTGFFPNDFNAELRACRHLSDLQIAPALVHALQHERDSALLIEAHDACQPEPGQMGALLARLHALPPVGQRRLVLCDCDSISGEVADLMADAGPFAELLPPPPRPTAPVNPGFALLHGDPVPANFVGGSASARLVDWSCAGLGDPAHDLALALSPAMFHLYGQGSHVAHASALVTGYGPCESYAALAPWLHYRIAAYCLWKAAKGAEGYLEAAEAEIDHLGALALG